MSFPSSSTPRNELPTRSKLWTVLVAFDQHKTINSKPAVTLFFKAPEDTPIKSRIIYMQADLPAGEIKVEFSYSRTYSEKTRRIFKKGKFRNDFFIDEIATAEMSFSDSDLRKIWIKMVMEGGMKLKMNETEKSAKETWKTLSEKDFLMILKEVEKRMFLVRPKDPALLRDRDLNDFEVPIPDQSNLLGLAGQLKRAFEDFGFSGENKGLDVRAFEVRLSEA
ncbi:hypothetical protein BDW74DRAFT_179152 [Aspergillus multicolor]|uniref:uncharacterized protein n=1 Tax=Aspergillus multicolor TaxID=41759 RepID=UPI003CCE4940